MDNYCWSVDLIVRNHFPNYGKRARWTIIGGQSVWSFVTTFSTSANDVRTVNSYLLATIRDSRFSLGRSRSRSRTSSILHSCIFKPEFAHMKNTWGSENFELVIVSLRVGFTSVKSRSSGLVVSLNRGLGPIACRDFMILAFGLICLRF